MFYFQIYEWKPRWKDGSTYVEGKQKVRERTKTRPALIIAALPEEEDDGRDKRLMESRGSSERMEGFVLSSRMDRMDVGCMLG
ncbi:hypothetical protein PBY51_005423 [Eleginops maclovinus]|uniref:Uncharacterized protein n=1 Tax=Eleginops maclovinus TaxID=56733 RepID=A0AAN8AGP0_ELEMC|nr:hypothetical protein PBY51_005423 [Eleginops maclovinus]